MATDQRLVEATASRWTWARKCWGLREPVRALASNGQLEALRDANHLLKLEVESLKAKLNDESIGHKLAKDGNLALLKFIHTGHRLNLKFDPDSIRAALARKP